MLLRRIADLFERRIDALAEAMTMEMGVPATAAKTIHFPSGPGHLREAARILETFEFDLPRGSTLVTKEPIGVCGLITPWNFPINQVVCKVAPALAAGCTMVLKPSEISPLSALLIAEIIDEAGVPPGVFNLVNGDGAEAGHALAAHPDVDMISFTGSTDVGRQISIACAPQFKHVHLEMGGKNVILVMDDADVDLAVDGALWGAFGTAGQRCTAASRIVAHRRIYDEFVEKLSARAKALRVGNGLDANVDMGPNISASQIDTIASYVKIGKDEGATVTAGGATLTDGSYGKGHFHQPTVFANVTPEMRIAQEEIFGPVTAVMRCDSLEEAINIGNGVKYGLSSSIYTRDINKAFVAMRDMYTGIFYVNAPTIGAEVHLPFGGTKQTGNGHREAGIAGIDVFSEWKSIYVDYSGSLQRAQIDTEEV